MIEDMPYGICYNMCIMLNTSQSFNCVISLKNLLLKNLLILYYDE